MQIPEEIKQYLNGVLNEAGMEHVSGSTRETMLEELYLKLDDFLIDRVVDYLPVEKLDEFTRLMEEQPAREKVDAYLRANVPHMQDVFTVAFADFKTSYITAVKEAKQQTLK